MLFTLFSFSMHWLRDLNKIESDQEGLSSHKQEAKRPLFSEACSWMEQRADNVWCKTVPYLLTGPPAAISIHEIYIDVHPATYVPGGGENLQIYFLDLTKTTAVCVKYALNMHVNYYEISIEWPQRSCQIVKFKTSFKLCSVCYLHLRQQCASWSYVWQQVITMCEDIGQVFIERVWEKHDMSISELLSLLWCQFQSNSGKWTIKPCVRVDY